MYINLNGIKTVFLIYLLNHYWVNVISTLIQVIVFVLTIAITTS